MFYSDIFNTYKSNDGNKFKNILKKIQLPTDKTTELYKKYIIPHTMPWTTISYFIYGDLTLYWMILLANQDKKLNPLYGEVADEIYIINPLYKDLVIEAINEEIQ